MAGYNVGMADRCGGKPGADANGEDWERPECGYKMMVIKPDLHNHTHTPKK